MGNETEDPNLENVAENMSEVNPDVAEKPAEGETLPPPPAAEKSGNPGNGKADIRDRYGRAFDPALHEMDDAGAPRLNRDGFLACKPGRPGKSARIRGGSGPRRPDLETAQVDTQAQKAEIQRRNTARISTALFIKMGVGLFGEEWLPQRIQGMNEQEELEDLFDEYYRSKGMSDIPPNVALALGLIGYAGARIHLPETRSRFPILWNRGRRFVGNIVRGIGKAVRGLFGFFKKLKFKGVKNASHAHSGDDRKRQDNPGAETREEVQGPGNAVAGA